MIPRDRPPVAGEVISTILKSQYHRALTMLRESVEKCPEDLWYSAVPTNAFWQVAYHALFFAHLYIQPNEEAFRPWSGHQSAVQYPDGIPGPADPNSALPLNPRPYSKAEALAYWALCDQMVDPTIDTLDLSSQNSGFSWYPISKLEHQLVSLRHIQHHAAQLADRVRAATGEGVRWR